MRAKNEFKFIAEAYQAVHTEKIKGADGKACWGGYRYAGTEDGKDKCVKVEDEETQQKFKIYFTTALNPDGEDAEGWISHGTDEEDAWDNLYNYFKSIPPGPGYRGRNLMSFYRVQIEPYKEGDPCSTAMGPCEDITVKVEDEEGNKNKEFAASLFAKTPEELARSKRAAERVLGKRRNPRPQHLFKKDEENESYEHKTDALVAAGTTKSEDINEIDLSKWRDYPAEDVMKAVYRQYGKEIPSVDSYDWAITWDKKVRPWLKNKFPDN